MPTLLGIDSGLTVTKAVIFDIDGTPLAAARRRVTQFIPKARHIERDMDELWNATADAIREAISLSGRPASDIEGIAATAHGDGIYLLDHARKPLGRAILSLDSRAGAIVDRWTKSDVADLAIELTGQIPHVSAPSALLAWIREMEPERYKRIGHFISCKDWLRFCLTGIIGTDRTEASTSFTNVKTQNYSEDALRLFGLEDLVHALPPASRSDQIVGRVTREAAQLTGLAEGTPVVAGLHDVTASALGAGAMPRVLSRSLPGPIRSTRRFRRNHVSTGAGSAATGLHPASGTACRSPRHRQRITTGFWTRSALPNGRMARCKATRSMACWRRDRCRFRTPLDGALPSLSVRLALWRSSQRRFLRARWMARPRRHAARRA